MASSRRALSADETAFLINHLVLPTNLPQGDDYCPLNERALLEVTIEALEEFRNTLRAEESRQVEDVLSTIKNLLHLRNTDGYVSEQHLSTALQGFTNGVTQGAIPLEIKAQNAAVIISRHDDGIVFEAFELSPANAAVMTCEGRLRRSFPDIATLLKTETFHEQELRASLSQAVAKMSWQPAPDFQPRVRKAGQQHEEDRDTTNPGLVTNHLIGNVLAAIGKVTNVSNVSKNCRDEILWDNSRLPFRRNPLWLLIRVTAQLSFSRSAEKSGTTCKSMYKEFMVYLLAKILDAAQKHLTKLGPDAVLAISAKLSRRLLKLGILDGPDPTPQWLAQVRDSMIATQYSLDGKWETVRNEAQVKVGTSAAVLKGLNPQNDLNVHLPDLDRYIDRMAARKHEDDFTVFQPKETHSDFPPHELPTALETSGEYRYFKLAALETWVAQHLGKWLRSHIGAETTSGKLRDMIQRYYAIANSLYANDPRSLSIMYLTIMELWVACDRTTCATTPLLREFNPEIPIEQLQLLLLPLKGHLERLHKVEVYVASRKKSANLQATPIIQGFGDASSFAVQYFDQSPAHQELLSRIEKKATAERQKKRTELADKEQQYRDLLSKHAGMDCEEVEVITDSYHGYKEMRHYSNSCAKCSTLRQAENMKIQVHEWPLSSDIAHAKATVFELDVPIAFSEWRELYVFLVKDVLKCHYRQQLQPDFSYRLPNDHGLSSFFLGNGSRRIGLLSEVKPHLVTHRSHKKVGNLTEGNVCLQNGLQYMYFDEANRSFTHELCPTDELSARLMFQLPRASSRLQKFLSRIPSTPNGPSPNQVLADQSGSPTHFSLAEFKAFGSLALGINIQYHNILTQLAMPVVDFSKVETQVLIFQTITQASQQSDEVTIERAAHSVMTDEVFGNALVCQLRTAIQRVTENWELWRALATFIQLTARLLTLARSAEILSQCMSLLAESRKICMRWLETLSERARASEDDKQRAQLRSRAAEIALVAISTFDVDQLQLDSILSSSEAASHLLQSSMVVQDSLGSTTSDHIHLYNASLQVWRSVMHRALPVLKTKCFNGKCLDDAVVASWSGFRAAAQGWKSLPSVHKQFWLVTNASPVGSVHDVTVHFNLLTAQLLVNGLPVARLPAEYTAQQMYSRLFQKACLEVVPASTPGFQFESKGLYRSHVLRFGMETNPNNSHLSVQATRDNQQFELCPASLLHGKFPNSFLNEYIHWYDHNKNEIELCPISNPFDTSNPAHWRLSKVDKGWRLSKQGVSLVNFSSRTARELSRAVVSIESHTEIHMLFRSAYVDIELPRLRLSFRLNRGDSHIHSRQYRGMIIDTNQDIDTLIGLSSKLVLKHESTHGDRVVLVPETKDVDSIRYRKTADHVSVSITPGSVKKVHAYQIDEIAGRLKGTSLESSLLLCYLHALTSYPIPDKLTSRTGTEMALWILQSGAVRSFETLTQDNLNMLTKIAKLSPSRVYYPRNLRVMQTVSFDSQIHDLSQHPLFYTYVEEIFSQAQQCKLFYPGDAYIDPPAMKAMNPFLFRRDLIRSSVFRISGSGAEHHSVKLDKLYEGRGGEQSSERGRRSFVAATLVLREDPALNSAIPSTFRQTLADSYLKLNTVRRHSSEAFEPNFDSKWLKNPSSFLSELWCKLHFSLWNWTKCYNKYDVMMWLSTAAFAKDANMDIIQALVAFYRFSDISKVSYARMPNFESLDLNFGSKPNIPVLKKCIGRARSPYHTWTDSSVTQNSKESYRKFQTRRQRIFQDRQDEAITKLASALEQQWPRQVPQKPADQPTSPFLDITKAVAQCQPNFQKWYTNRCFEEYLVDVTSTITRHRVMPVPTPNYPNIKKQKTQDATHKVRFITTEHVLSETPPLSLPAPPQCLDLSVHQQFESSQDGRSGTRLVGLCDDLLNLCTSESEKRYVDHLRDSFQALKNSPTRSHAVYITGESAAILGRYSIDCRRYLDSMYLILHRAITTGTSAEKASGDPSSSTDFRRVHRWQIPRISTNFFLQQLNHDNWMYLSDEWKTAIVKYALAITELQRAQRMKLVSNSPIDLAAELDNSGHVNWNPAEFPESLLLEAESGILIRKVQSEIADQMRHPPNLKNCVMQLNMGEGKSTVVMPVVVAALADKSRLVRTIVAKPQSKQMLQMLVSKLGGLLNRRVYHMPFSRALTLSKDQVEAIALMLRQCMANRGVVLLQPEHILSFRLQGIEALLSGRKEIGEALLRIQSFFDTNTRDLVDESDENFSVKFELVYTMGTQLAVNFAPDRWYMIHRILELAARYAENVKDETPDSIEIAGHTEEGRFPRIRTLKEDATTRLLHLIAEHICSLGFTGFPIHRQPKPVRQSVFLYITSQDLTQKEIDAVENGPFWTDSTRNPLLLIRGLIAGRILAFVFGTKRWRVNFGIDPSRSRLAVPFRSKDSPSPRAEYSHPDVVMALTSLCYYYGGLSDDELDESLTHLTQSDQADIEYAQWVAGAKGLPQTFRHLTGINLKDRVSCEANVFPFLRHSKAAVDYYLARTVFPKEMKEFPQKLSASGWDIAQVKPHPTTGFSGTNDSRHVLPLNIAHLDLPSQKHTNALVLSYLLQDENSVELLQSGSDSATANVAEYLLMAVKDIQPQPRLIIDVGALVLELNNYQLAKKWLDISNPDLIKAVVFFSEDEELSVLDRNGISEALHTSPYAKQLDVCLIYLDEAHTRGTDLRLPRDYRAAVTLGKGVTKDKLVQACMRMRKLGKGQSVVFLVPDEIRLKILAQKSPKDSGELTVADVLAWAVTETWTDLRAAMPLWATQGRRFENHKNIFKDSKYTKENAELFLEDEAQSLESRYRPQSQATTAKMLDGWDTSNDSIREILQRCRDFEATNIRAADLHAEQERELSPEMESERQIEKPAKMKAQLHKIHPDVLRLVKSGHTRSRTGGIISAWQALQHTKVGAICNLRQIPEPLMVTEDYARTVQGSFLDSFQRSVQWVLSVHNNHRAIELVVLSPFEANTLLTDIRKSSRVTLHLYSPRPNLAYAPLDELLLYTVGRPFVAGSLPRNLMVQLNLFSGQLYLRSYDEYTELLDFLGLAWSAAKDGQTVRADGFIVPSAGHWKLLESPVKFLKDFISTVRRDCEAIDKTHIGKILDGALLEERDFD